MTKVMIIGDTSAIAYGTAKCFYDDGADLFLVASTTGKLACLASYLQCVHSSIYKSGVSVVTIKPGLVDSPMTASLRKGPLFSSPQRVGQGVYQAMKKGKAVVYLPGYWRVIMFVVRNIPEGVFKQ